MKPLNNIQKIRWDRNISLRQLSKLSGVSHTEISMIENGLKTPTQITILRLCKALNMPVNKVFRLDYENIDLDNL